MKTCRELARAMNISASTVYRAVADKRIQSVLAGDLVRIPPAEYERVLSEGFPRKARRDAHGNTGFEQSVCAE